MGLRDRVLAAQAEIEIRAGNAAAAAKAAGSAPAETEQERESRYTRELIRPHLARWCTEMGIDSPTPEFTVVDVRESQNRPLAVTVRFSVEDLSFEGEYRKWDTGDKMNFYLPQHHGNAGYEINNLNDLVHNLGRPEVRYSSMK